MNKPRRSTCAYHFSICTSALSPKLTGTNGESAIRAPLIGEKGHRPNTSQTWLQLRDKKLVHVLPESPKANDVS